MRLGTTMNELHERVAHCRGEIEALSKSIETWAERAITYCEYPYPHAAIAEVKAYSISGRQHAEPPIGLRSATGMIANELRACLDGLACTLADRHSGGHAGTYFPISKTQAIFEDDGRKKMKRLSPSDQVTIAALKPYGGGDSNLFGLHELDRNRKHIRLGRTATHGGVALGGDPPALILETFEHGEFRDITVNGVHIEQLSVNTTQFPELEERIVVLEGIPLELEARPLPTLVFAEPPQLHGERVDEWLGLVADRVEQIVALFD